MLQHGRDAESSCHLLQLTRIKTAEPSSGPAEAESEGRWRQWLSVAGGSVRNNTVSGWSWRGRISAALQTPGGHILAQFDLRPSRKFQAAKPLSHCGIRSFQAVAAAKFLDSCSNQWSKLCWNESLKPRHQPLVSLMIMSRKRHVKPNWEKNPLTSGQLSSKTTSLEQF